MTQAKSALVAHAHGHTSSPDPAPSEMVSVIRRSSGHADQGHDERLRTPSAEWTRIRETAAQHLDRFISLEAKVLRGDDPEAVHDMRVASRRVQQILDVLYPAPVPKEIRRLNRRVRRARRVLSELRNYDVQIERVNRSLARKANSRRDVWEGVKGYLDRRRAVTFEEGLRKLGKLNLATLYVRLKNQLATNDARSGAHTNGSGDVSADPEQQSREGFEARLGQSLAVVWQVYETRVSESERDPSRPVLHAVRIAAKRLRYLIEVMHEVDITGSAEALVWLRRLQQHLGDWHDLEVLEQILIEMVARPKFLRDQLDLAIAIEKVIQRNRIAKKKYIDRYFQIVASSEGNQRIKEWVARFKSDAELGHVTQAL
jgi:CHAD domain-containing protein